MHRLNVLTTGPPRPPTSGRDYLSYSAVSLFAACPLRYYFRYVAGLPEQFVSATLAFGSAFHAGLECHFEQLLATHSAPDLNVLLDAFWVAWHRNTMSGEVQFPRGEDLNSLGRLADRMFRAFQTSSLAHPSGKIIAVEEELRGVLIPGLPDLLARVDLILDTDDSLEVIDFKTARSSWSEEHVADSAGQLLLYHELVKEWADDRPVRLAFGVVSKAKAPQVVLHAVPVDAHQLDRTKRIVERVWRAIQHGQVFPNPSPINCATCSYRRQCREWTG